VLGETTTAVGGVSQLARSADSLPGWGDMSGWETLPRPWERSPRCLGECEMDVVRSPRPVGDPTQHFGRLSQHVGRLS